MAAKKKPVGRPSKYNKKYCKAIIDYFDIEPCRTIIEKFHYKNGDEKEKEVEVPNELPLIQGFCRKVGISKSTLHLWVEKHPEFSDAYNIAKGLQEAMWIQNGLRGLYNPSFAIFTGKNMFGWRDQVTFEGNEEKPLKIIFERSTNKNK